MASTIKPEVTKEDVQKAQNLWAGFTEMMKWAVISVIGTLALMAFFLI